MSLPNFEYIRSINYVQIIQLSGLCLVIHHIFNIVGTFNMWWTLGITSWFCGPNKLKSILAESMKLRREYMYLLELGFKRLDHSLWAAHRDSPLVE